MVSVLSLSCQSDATFIFAGSPAVISMEASNLLEASAGDQISVCPLCESSVLNMRNHIRQHILRALSNTPEEVILKEPVHFF